jgi:copper transporter 1
MSAEQGPRMLMYWHGGINDYMMFKEWVPQTVGSYAGAWILFFFITILLEALLTYRHNTELVWNKNAVAAHNSMLASEISSSTPLSATPQAKAFPWWQRSILEAIFQFLESGLAYFVMLVTMIFNIGLFFAIVLGHAVGVFFFYRLRVNPKGSKNGGTPILRSPNSEAHSPTPSESESQPPRSCH